MPKPRSEIHFPELETHSGQTRVPGSGHLPCDNCGEISGDVKVRDARTCYPTPRITRYHRLSGNYPENPNAPIPLCSECAREHNEFWDFMWVNSQSLLLGRKEDRRQN